MTSTRTIKEPFLDGSNTTFLSRALSQGNAVATPLWKEAVLDIPCGSEWSIVDALIDGDLDDCIQEEVQCYAFSDFTGSAGVLMLHYEIEFKDPLYTFHPTLIPVPQGNGTFATFQDYTDIRAVTDAVVLSFASIALVGGDGTIFRMVFRQEASTLPTGVASWPLYGKVLTTLATTTTTVGSSFTNITMSSGTTVYGVLANTLLTLYDSLETAVAGGASGALIHQNAQTLKGTYAFIMHTVRLGGAVRVVNQ